MSHEHTLEELHAAVDTLSRELSAARRQIAMLQLMSLVQRKALLQALPSDGNGFVVPLDPSLPEEQLTGSNGELATSIRVFRDGGRLNVEA